MINRKNIPLYVALAIPVIMIIVIAIAIYAPGIGKGPKINFLYSSGYGYLVSLGHVTKVTSPIAYPPVTQPLPQQLYLYNVTTNQSQEISLADAEKLSIDPSAQSADGYSIEQGNSGGSFPFGGYNGDYNTWYIKGYNRAIKLNLKLNASNPYNYNQFQFVGWINN